MSRTARYDQGKRKKTKQKQSAPQPTQPVQPTAPQQPVQNAQGFVKQKRTHGFLSFLVGVVFILTLVVRMTVLSGTFMEGALQTPTVINRVHTEVASQLEAKNLPTSLATDDLIKAVLKTGTRETYAGESLNFNTASIRNAVQDDVNQQAASIGIAGTTASDAIVNLISGQVLNQVSANYHDDNLTYFANHIRSYQTWADILLVVSGILWLLLMISNHRRRRARRLNRKQAA